MMVNLLFLVSMSLVCFIPIQAASDQYFSIAGASVGTTAYQWAAGIADVVGKTIPGIKATAEETNGYVENLRLFLNGNVEAGFSHAGLAHQAYLGEGAFKGTPKGRILGWMSMPPMIIHVYTLDGSKISSIKDLAGKRVGVGQIGGSPYFDLGILLETAKLKGKIKGFEVKIAEQSSMLSDGQLDVGMWSGSPPIPSIMELCVTKKVKFIPISDALIKSISKKYPFFYKKDLPANSYPGQTAPVQSFAVQVAGLLRADVPEDVAYKATKAIFENIENLKKVHSGFNQVTKEKVLEGMTIPLHPGVLRYYREIKVPGIEEYVAKTKRL